MTMTKVTMMKNTDENRIGYEREGYADCISFYYAQGRTDEIVAAATCTPRVKAFCRT